MVYDLSESTMQLHCTHRQNPNHSSIAWEDDCMELVDLNYKPR